MIKKRRIRRKYAAYLRGPLPEVWFKKAESIKGAALVLGLMLWKKSYRFQLWGEGGQAKESEEMYFTDRELKEWGSSKAARDRVLPKMVDAGLVKVTRKKGVSPRIKIIDQELLDE